MTPQELKKLTTNLKVLYVEDDKDLRESSAKMFSQFFDSIDTAEDGQVGLRLYEKNTYDLVITDIIMPHMNGIEMIEKIKTINPTQAIIVTSAHNDSDSLFKLIELGVDKFLLKPMGLRQLIDALIQTAFYIKNQKEYYHFSKEIVVLRAEVASLKAKLAGEKTPLKDEPIEFKLSNADFQLLKLLEKKLSKTIYDVQMSGDFPDHLKDGILTTLEQYANVLLTVEDYKEIVVQLNKLDQSIEKDEEVFQNNINNICNLLESVSNNLTHTRKSHFEKENVAFLIKSMKRIMAALRP